MVIFYATHIFLIIWIKAIMNNEPHNFVFNSQKNETFHSLAKEYGDIGKVFYYIIFHITYFDKCYREYLKLRSVQNQIRKELKNFVDDHIYHLQSELILTTDKLVANFCYNPKQKKYNLSLQIYISDEQKNIYLLSDANLRVELKKNIDQILKIYETFKNTRMKNIVHFDLKNIYDNDDKEFTKFFSDQQLSNILSLLKESLELICKELNFDFSSIYFNGDSVTSAIDILTGNEWNINS